jgi:hypothetical protein
MPTMPLGVMAAASIVLQGPSAPPEPVALQPAKSKAETAARLTKIDVDFFIEIPFSVMDGLVSTTSRLLSQEFVEVFLTDDGGVPRVAVV